ncbi:MAG TPA: bifunctional DNA-formamidopyrimidine glycosylase/DNA-(apurinic or apyrimidinic site) lyase [Longimicrobiales bacterium]|nr:bifunctional DNA-formamidopyrimidine glycosylase/DNA-(apurinic or apyrimidinic site) lyase [Longimicrobiales bacterium]
MPELPEAETIASDLRRRVEGARVRGAVVPRPDILSGIAPGALDRRLRGRRIERVGRRGKNVLLELDDGARVCVNLGMTGRLLTSDAPNADEMGHVAARFALDDGRELLFDDTRRFGRIELLEPRAWAERDAALGLEPLSDAFTPAALRALTRRSRSPIRNWLLDQRFVAGVGNIYANEALHLAAVRPRRGARTLRRRETDALHRALRDVLRRAVRARGTTLRDFLGGGGEVGSFRPRLRVYGRAGEPCLACGTPVKRVVFANRSAFYCPTCQR